MNVAVLSKRSALGRGSSLPTFFDNLDSFAEAPAGVAKLPEVIHRWAEYLDLVEVVV